MLHSMRNEEYRLPPEGALWLPVRNEGINLVAAGGLTGAERRVRSGAVVSYATPPASAPRESERDRRDASSALKENLDEA
jgi:hypothetical protein